MSELAVGQSIQGKKDVYQVASEIAKGGFGTTYLATASDGQKVVIKTLHTARLREWKSYELFEREIQVLRRLDHPQIPNYIDDMTLGDNASDGIALVQEYVDGYALSEVLSGNVSMDEGKLVRWFADVLEILVYLHGQSPPVIHRDITPGNILIRHSDGVPYLVDFGTVQAALRSAAEVASTSVGTFGYAPMEQFVGSAFPASDLYALGVTVLAVAQGREPADMEFSGIRVTIPSHLGLDARLRLLLERMTEPDPERRLGDARIALEQLRPLRARYGVTREASPAALQALAATRPQVEGRASIASDDLLTSERIREAAARLKSLGSDALGIPTLGRCSEDLEARAVSSSGNFLAADYAVIAAERMEVVGTVPRGRSIYALTSSADRALTYERDDHWREAGCIYKADRPAIYALGETVSCAGKDIPPAFSPDGRTLVGIEGKHFDGGAIDLYDSDTGNHVQHIDGSFAAFSYSPDGQILAATGDDGNIRLYYQDGQETTIEGTCLAFAPDGRSMAVVQREALLTGSPQDLRPIAKLSSSTRKRCVFSPDGRHLAIHNYSDDYIEIIDIQSGRELARIVDPHNPKGTLRGVGAMAFSADGNRLFVACDLYYGRYDHNDHDCIGVWSVPSVRYLGAILRASIRDEEELVLSSASGYWGVLDPSIEHVPSDDPWYRPELARAALCGEPLDEHLEERQRAQLADVEARWAFFHDCRSQGILSENAELHTLMDAARGLTHVLDEALRRARDAQKARPAFGGGTRDIELTQDQMQSALTEVASLSAAEQDILCEEAILRYEARETEEAKRASEQALASPQSPTALQGSSSQSITPSAESNEQALTTTTRGLSPITVSVLSGLVGLAFVAFLVSWLL